MTSINMFSKPRKCSFVVNFQRVDIYRVIYLLIFAIKTSNPYIEIDVYHALLFWWIKIRMKTYFLQQLKPTH
jgi:hypothetical protein